LSHVVVVVDIHGCNAETLPKTHAKAGQHRAELKDRFVDDTE